MRQLNSFLLSDAYKKHRKTMSEDSMSITKDNLQMVDVLYFKHWDAGYSAGVIAAKDDTYKGMETDIFVLSLTNEFRPFAAEPMSHRLQGISGDGVDACIIQSVAYWVCLDAFSSAYAHGVVDWLAENKEDEA